jgi:hypothetical protein
MIIACSNKHEHAQRLFVATLKLKKKRNRFYLPVLTRGSWQTPSLNKWTHVDSLRPHQVLYIQLKNICTFEEIVCRLLPSAVHTHGKIPCSSRYLRGVGSIPCRKILLHGFNRFLEVTLTEIENQKWCLYDFFLIILRRMR